MSYIHLYQENPTIGLTDGVQVSEAGTQTSPISFTLNATSNEIGSSLKCAIRTDSGFQTTSGVSTTITPTGTNYTMWRLSLDNITWSDWGLVLTISSQITPINIILYVQAKSVSTETPMNDVSTTLQVAAQIEAV